MKIWECRIGSISVREFEALPAGADHPMRRAVETAYFNLTGRECNFHFSGWGATLDKAEQAVVEGRMPPTFFERLRIEHSELYDRYEKLRYFIEDSGGFSGLADNQQRLLKSQRGVMLLYLEILEQRIDSLGMRPTVRAGANIHGIGPDTDGGPNPDYKPSGVA